jgi:F-type H+-transporting ATPase subunit b
MPFILLSFAGNSIQLVPDGSLILHGAIIIIMVVVLNRTLFKPINRILQERASRTYGLVAEARKALETVDESLKQYEKTLRGARAEGYGLLELQRLEAMRERERQMASAKEVLGEQTAAAKRDIEAQAEDARTTLGKEAQKMAQKISAQILGRPVIRAGE